MPEEHSMHKSEDAYLKSMFYEQLVATTRELVMQLFGLRERGSDADRSAAEEQADDV